MQVELATTPSILTADAITGAERSSLARLLLLVIPFSAEAVVEAFEWSCRGGTAPALALVGFALLQPSLLSSGSTALSLAA